MIATCSPTQLPLCSFPRQPFIGFSSQLSLSVRLLSLILFVLHPSQQAARQRQSCKNGRRPPLCSPLTPGTRGGGGGDTRGDRGGVGGIVRAVPPASPPPTPHPRSVLPLPPAAAPALPVPILRARSAGGWGEVGGERRAQKSEASGSERSKNRNTIFTEMPPGSFPAY